jgi:hypothetical protein
MQIDKDGDGAPGMINRRLLPRKEQNGKSDAVALEESPPSLRVVPKFFIERGRREQLDARDLLPVETCSYSAMRRRCIEISNSFA